MRRAAALTVCVVALAACGGSADAPPKPRPDPEVRAVATQATAEGLPSSPIAWGASVRAWLEAASSGDRFDPATGTYTDEGKETLRRAVASWQKYVALDDPDDERRSSLATRMVQVYVALEDMPAAARAQEIITEHRGTVSTYAQLAVISYQAGQVRKGDLAAAKAVKLADPSEKDALKGQLEAAAEQAAPAP